METTNEKNVQESEQSTRKTIIGELALLVAVLINSFGVVLMLYSNAGISAISSVPYAFSLAWPKLSLGTWTYIFQAALIISLMVMRKKFVLNYLFSFAVGFVFSEFLDLHELWIILRIAINTGSPARHLYPDLVMPSCQQFDQHISKNSLIRFKHIQHLIIQNCTLGTFRTFFNNFGRIRLTIL